MQKKIERTVAICRQMYCNNECLEKEKNGKKAWAKSERLKLFDRKKERGELAVNFKILTQKCKKNVIRKGRQKENVEKDKNQDRKRRRSKILTLQRNNCIGNSRRVSLDYCPCDYFLAKEKASPTLSCPSGLKKEDQGNQSKLQWARIRKVNIDH